MGIRKYQIYGLPVLVGLLVAVQVFLRTKSNVVLSFDSWVYWESALSLAAGKGFVTSTGEAVVSWPPLFSMLLASWDRLFTLDLSGVRSLLVTLSFAAGCLWSIAWRLHCKSAKPYAVVLGLLFIILYLPVWYDGLLSEALWLPLLGLLFILFGSQELRPRNLFLISLVLTLCLLCRNQSIVLVPALLIFVATRSGLRATVPYFLPILIAVALWVLTRSLLDQTSSHALALGKGMSADSLAELINITGGLVSITKAYLSYFTLLIIGVLVAVLTGNTLKQLSQGTIKNNSGVAWVFLALVFWLGTVAVSILAGMPVDQPRFYLFSVFSLVLGLILLVAESNERTIVLLASAVLVISLLTTGYRAMYFVQHRSQLNSVYAATFKPDPQWVEQTMSSIQSELRDGETIESAAGRFGISPNTYRRWKGAPLVFQPVLKPSL